MLKENNVRVNEICYAVGFKYPSYFTKRFKEVYGLLPADYRKKWSKNT
jgi:YesN/AraC family two-component response regulator